jgi:hypothetical protein
MLDSRKEAEAAIEIFASWMHDESVKSLRELRLDGRQTDTALTPTASPMQSQIHHQGYDRASASAVGNDNTNATISPAASAATIASIGNVGSHSGIVQRAGKAAIL